MAVIENSICHKREWNVSMLLNFYVIQYFYLKVTVKPVFRVPVLNRKFGLDMKPRSHSWAGSPSPHTSQVLFPAAHVCNLTSCLGL
jgi:hypothetical protein